MDEPDLSMKPAAIIMNSPTPNAALNSQVPPKLFAPCRHRMRDFRACFTTWCQGSPSACHPKRFSLPLGGGGIGGWPFFSGRYFRRFRKPRLAALSW